ncbi:MAG: GNAT family N-acetyltransferase [Alphaproteobacteria bacterium]|nr:GNAT family N-acetyltransferase [Alphaproteobacteria bacterium]NNF23381.1 GNAT family N-acetyltransferase [Paracoccaceae bacterium]
MSAALHIAGPADLAALLPLVAAYHAHAGIEADDDHRRAALEPLLEGSPLGVVYLIGPRRAPIGYIAITFGWSIELGGMDGFIDEFFIRPGVRGRGVGSEVLEALLPRLEEAGVKALHLEARAGDTVLERLYGRHRFKLRDGFHLMTRTARRR